MMRAYDEGYVYDAMDLLGEAFDCAVERGGLDLQVFFDLFVSTGVADAFGSGNPRIVAGMSGGELVLEVSARSGLDVGLAALEVPPDSASVEYWCGWILAYYQWKTAQPFRNIARTLSMDELAALYSPLHEASEDKCVEVLLARTQRGPSSLKAIRQARGVSQAALAEMSGVSLRAIQQYEQRVKDINKARVDAVYRLAHVLGCRIEDVLEFPFENS